MKRSLVMKSKLLLFSFVCDKFIELAFELISPDLLVKYLCERNSENSPTLWSLVAFVILRNASHLTSNILLLRLLFSFGASRCVDNSCCCCWLPDPFRGMGAWRETMEPQKPGNYPGSGPKVVKRQRVAKE